MAEWTKRRLWHQVLSFWALYWTGGIDKPITAILRASGVCVVWIALAGVKMRYYAGGDTSNVDNSQMQRQNGNKSADAMCEKDQSRYRHTIHLDMICVDS